MRSVQDFQIREQGKQQGFNVGPSGHLYGALGSRQLCKQITTESFQLSYLMPSTTTKLNESAFGSVKRVL